MAEPEQSAGPDQAAGNGPATGSSAEELLELLRRERAEFLNFKRRVERERTEDRERAAIELLQRLLPLLDELDRALEQLPADLKRHPWAEGVALSRHRLVEALDQIGVTRVGAEGEPFDPACHEALYYDESPRETDRRVASVIRPGYRLGDRLLRPAQVGVVGPTEGAARPDTDEARAERRAVAPERPRRNTSAGG